MNGYERELKKLLSAHGWTFARHGKGSHEGWSKPGAIPVTIPKDCLSRHLANAILKRCGIKHRF